MMMEKMKTPKLIMMVGLPGSGKSTWAASQEGYTVVNKDDIRAELSKKCCVCGGFETDHERDGAKHLPFIPWKWSRENEKDVVGVRDESISKLLTAGTSVISSDTNFGRKHKVRLSELARIHGAEFEIKRFDVPLAVCIERDSKREGSARVGADVIRKMYNQYVVNDPGHWPNSAAKVEDKVEKVEHVAGAPFVIICDLDGTLAMNDGHRSFYDASKCDEDKLNGDIWTLLHTLKKDGFEIVYCSGREDKYRGPTLTFLEKHACPVGPVFMRTSGDFRKDSIVKRELFDANIRGKFNVLFVLDDRNQVVKMWRELGLTCLQVAEGDF